MPTLRDKKGRGNHSSADPLCEGGGSSSRPQSPVPGGIQGGHSLVGSPDASHCLINRKINLKKSLGGLPHCILLS